MQIYLTAAGNFGRAVAERLATEHPVVHAAAHEVADPSRWHPADLHVVVTWREMPALFDLADRQAHLLRRPWLPVTLDATSLRVGPLVPGTAGGPCYRCFLARQFQHRRLRDTDRRLFDLYDRDPECGVDGFLAAHVELAVVAVGLSVAALRAGSDGEAGRLRRFGLLEPSAVVDGVLPVHGCSRCGVVDPDAGWADLARDVGGILEDPVEDLLDSMPAVQHSAVVR